MYVCTQVYRLGCEKRKVNFPHMFRKYNKDTFDEIHIYLDYKIG